MNEQEKPPKSDSKNEGSIGKGIGIGLLIYVVTIFFGSYIGSVLLFSGPVLHLLAIIYFFAKKQKYTGIGLLILAGIAILLVSACFGIVLTQFNG